MKISGQSIVISGSGGAILGGSFGGPIGAIIGAVAGATVGLIASDDKNSGEKPGLPTVKEPLYQAQANGVVESDTYLTADREAPAVAVPERHVAPVPVNTAVGYSV